MRIINTKHKKESLNQCYKIYDLIIKRFIDIN